MLAWHGHNENIWKPHSSSSGTCRRDGQAVLGWYVHNGGCHPSVACSVALAYWPHACQSTPSVNCLQLKFNSTSEAIIFIAPPLPACIVARVYEKFHIDTPRQPHIQGSNVNTWTTERTDMAVVSDPFITVCHVGKYWGTAAVAFRSLKTCYRGRQCRPRVPMTGPP